MSSALKHFSQIPVRAKFLLTVQSTTAYSPNAAWPAVGSVIDESSFNAGTDSNTSIIDDSGYLLKDLGRQAHVYDSVVPGEANNLIAIYREVQLVDGSSTEGVSGAEANGYNSFYVKVWDAAGSGVTVVRTG